jgi:putative mRNA 3-end processing factor
MLKPHQWLTLTPEGLYCIPGAFHIDPLYPVKAAIITHAHSDHARAGHGKTLSTPETIAIMQLRYGKESSGSWQTLNYHQSVIINQVQVYFLPAGHVLGSGQIVLEFAGSRVIISGDYKRRFDPTCPSFEPLSSDVFITEATFGLPIFKHPPIEEEIQKLFQSLTTFPACHLIGVYPLGKCQRLIKTLRLANYFKPIYLHGALTKLCELYESFGIELGELKSASLLNNESAAGEIVLCPPGALHDRWSRRFGETIRAYASGWMQIRARAKQKNIDLPLVISDHADWPELLQTIKEVHPQEVWVTHGLEDALVYCAAKQGYQAKALHLLGYEDTED